MLVFLLAFVSGSEDGHIPTFWLLLQAQGVEPFSRPALPGELL